MGLKPRIAVLMDMVFSEFQKEIARGIQDAAEVNNIDIIYFGLGLLDKRDPEDMRRLELLDFISSREFDGIITVTSVLVNNGGEDFLREKLGKLTSVPLVSIGPSILNESRCLCDNAVGIRDLMNHLIHHHGYTRFAFVSGPFDNDEALLRLEVFKDVLHENNIPFDDRDIYEGKFIPPSGYEAVDYFLDERRISPEVIVCANDFMALGVWNSLKDRGLAVPFDIAVTGFDDTQLARAPSHQFTTVNQSFFLLGYHSVDRILVQIQGESDIEDFVIPAELRIRSSCGCLDVEQRSFLEKGFQPAGIKSLQEIEQHILSFFESDKSVEDTKNLYKTWSDMIQKALEKNHLLYELEVMIRRIMAKLSKKPGMENSKVLLNSLYSLLLEQGGQSVFAEHWRKTFYSMNLRIMLDHLQDKMNRDNSLFVREKEFREIIRYCNADSCYLLQFHDYQDVGKGARMLFAFTDDWGADSVGKNRWFPPRGSGSFVCNIIADSENSFAYILLNESIPDKDIFNSLRLSLTSIAKDLIGRKEIRLLNEELKKEIEEKRKAEIRLKELLNDNHNLINVLAYDIKNPLSHIIYSLEILNDPSSDKKEREMSYNMANSSVMSCNSIIEDVLSLQRFKNEDIAIDFYLVDLEGCCSRLLSEFTKKASGKSITLIMNKQFNRTSFCTNQELLRSILRNLISNAIKFSDPDTEITFTVKVEKKTLSLTVCDQGPGFTEEDRKKLYMAFEPLTAKPTGKEKSTGLGLSLVNVLVKRLGGTINLETQVGKGSCFSVIIPEAEV